MDPVPTTSGPDPSEPVRLTSARTEFEAAMIADALRRRGIDARPVGSLTTGFRAEAPGEVQVMVRRADLERAREALRTIKDDSLDLPWNQPGIPPPDAPPGPEAASGPPPAQRWPWALVLVLLLPVGLFLTVITIARPDLDPAIRSIGPLTLLVALLTAAGLLLAGAQDPSGPRM